MVKFDARTLLRHLPMPDYYKTRMWALGLTPPIGSVAEWPYYRCIELATRGFATSTGYGTAFPGAGDASREYSLLEFGVGNGRTFELMLHFRDVWQRRLGFRNRLTAIGFDTFEGLPAERREDVGAQWLTGDHYGDVAVLERDLENAGWRDFDLVKGLYRDTLSSVERFKQAPPLFVSIDCDYYTSTLEIFDALLPDVAPHGCLFYFDDVSINFWSDKSGELQAIREVNEGRYGDHIQLSEYPLWIETGEMRHWKQTYRLVNLEKLEKLRHGLLAQRAVRPGRARRRRISPL